jgi:quinol monooxygenase YgiN
MIAIIATIRIHADKVAEFEEISRALEAAVRANEAGCLLYCMTKSRTEALTYKNMEIFRDQAALDQHVAADYFLAATGRMRACVSGPSNVEFLDPLST